ncbi:hypothetical protein GLOIN_2v1837698 [Rhizophagus irregularis DAOM 181602=DAOM 197198]|uniref:Uncharacterized protein n=1 Tax=Rhizophagus irregularis (strain DAOM 197198w) TaxID=1432141 RepID=A0A015IRE7_RHIIW|nr:hypothetical protein RirG_212760 [Rhizophagus irregularis DAOM 197198w]PKY19433.1 hypothetical protein RhiirB3_432479 [Rhizophagus irregularis]GBC21797.1 hypothetical protein GLOIN_2v1837698 [Rhizophagus irregularis DAOM 181602=DAOM 197198]
MFHSKHNLAYDPRFYNEHKNKIISGTSIKKRKQNKEVHSDRLGYTVSIKNYRSSDGQHNPYLYDVMGKSQLEQLEQQRIHPDRHIHTRRVYYKQYSPLRFDVVRSPNK